MKTVKSETLYEVYGHEFTDKAKAEAAEKLLAAKQAYEEAMGAYGRLLAATFKTADGQQFKWCEHYYWIAIPCSALPRMIRLWCSPSATVVDLDEYKEYVSLKIECDQDGWGNSRKFDPVRISIDELYRDERKASAALRAAQLSWLDEMRRTVEETKP